LGQVVFECLSCKSLFEKEKRTNHLI